VFGYYPKVVNCDGKHNMAPRVVNCEICWLEGNKFLVSVNRN